MSADLVTAIAAKALDGLFMRQTAITNNIANAGSNGVRPMRVDFEAALKRAVESGGARDDVARRVAHVAPALHPDALPLTGDSRLDLELTDSSETAMRYQMLLGMLDRHLQIRGLAVSEGRGS